MFKSFIGSFYCREISNDVKDWLVDYEKSHEVDMEEEKQSKECKDLCHCAGPPEGFVMQVGSLDGYFLKGGYLCASFSVYILKAVE